MEKIKVWERKKIRDLDIKIIDGDRGKNYPHQEDMLDQGDCIFLNAGNISEGDFDFTNSKFVSKERDLLMGKGKLIKYDIVLTTRGTVGKHAFYSDDLEFKDVRINSGMAIIRNLDKRLYTEYILAFMRSASFKKEILRVAFGSAQPQLTIDIIKNFKIPVPTLSEQKHIVSILQSYDSYLGAFESKIDAKRKVDSYLRQGLLTGERRIRGFHDEWKNIKLKKLGTTYSGLTGKNKEDFKTGDSKFISYMNIYLNPSLKKEGLLNVKIKEGEKQNKVKYGDLFFTTSSETPDEVGISSVLLEDLDCDAYLNSFCFGFRLHDFETIDPNFAKYYFRGQSFRKQMFRIAQGATRFNLSKKYFLDTEIHIPSSIAEQQAIAAILSSADKEIETLETKKKLIEQQRKYLLNNLITGSIRVPETIGNNLN